MEKVLEIHDLTVGYRGKPALWSVDTTLPAGTMAGILGPNGAGKSTLLKAVMGLVPIATGNVRVFERPINEVRKRVAYVPQRESVDWDFPATALDVALMGVYPRLGWFRRPGKAEKMFALECLDKVGMAPLKDRQIGKLSGGQQQRVFLARALAQNADLYLLDEPFAGVDMATEAQIVALLREIKASGKTVVAVHHDLHTAAEYFDRMILLNQRLIAAGPTNEVFTAENLQAAFGGKLTALTHLAGLIQNQSIPLRET
ncbi:MAG: metal ABC transporter ATP-binding protein [Bacteroidia bacterium]|nr:metal ABC transporter ATP-binding protein [Bacteroidia bacterium]MDW8334151.1 metal ABC transporter ATP-binding protein [Bacteroidia bacterium]